MNQPLYLALYWMGEVCCLKKVFFLSASFKAGDHICRKQQSVVNANKSRCRDIFCGNKTVQTMNDTSWKRSEILWKTLRNYTKQSTAGVNSQISGSFLGSLRTAWHRSWTTSELSQLILNLTKKRSVSRWVAQGYSRTSRGSPEMEEFIN